MSENIFVKDKLKLRIQHKQCMRAIQDKGTDCINKLWKTMGLNMNPYLLTYCAHITWMFFSYFFFHSGLFQTQNKFKKFQCAMHSRKRHVETSRREEKMGRVKGSGEREEKTPARKHCENEKHPLISRAWSLFGKWVADKNNTTKQSLQSKKLALS